MRILVVAESTPERRALRKRLKNLGHQCAVAADGATAWAMLCGDVDVVVSDWHLRDVDGPELCRRVRAHGGPAYTYFILLTAADDKAQVRRGMQAGADDCLAKPCDPEALEMALIAAARLSALHREQRDAQIQQARLEGVRLAARTMRHELGNKLAVTILYNERLAQEADGSTELHAAAAKALRSVREAASIMEQLGRITHVDVINWGPGARPTLQLMGAPA
jgi:DNA-binding response OmpR family regulator